MRKENEVFQDGAKGGNDNIPPEVKQHMNAVSTMSGQGPQQHTEQPKQKYDPVMDMLSQEFGIKIPTETVPLPSRGLLYPENHPWHNKSSIEIRPMTASEENILTSESLIKKGTLVSALIRACTVDNVNPLDLLGGDRNALLMAIRITGYGPLYDGEVKCSECNYAGARQFNIAQLGIKQLKLQPVVPNKNEFIFNLPQLKIPVHFRFQTGKDEEEMLRSSEALKKKGINQETVITNLLQNCIISVNGVEDKVKLSKFISMMPARDSNALRTFIKDNEPGVDLRIDSECPSCGNVEEVVMPMGVKFLWPNAE